MITKTMTFSIIFIFISQAFATSFCDSYQTPKHHTDLKSKVDEQIRSFFNKKPIAKQADDTLSKLLAAKSPIATNWLKKRDLDSKTEEEIIREWRDYFARNFILTKYPQKDSAIDKEIEKLIESINKKFSNKAFQNKLETLFKKSKASSLSVIKQMPFDDSQKKQLITKIEAIKLYWMKDFKTSKFKELPMEFLDWGIAYDPVTNEINIGINSLSYPNDETYLAVFAHEIGHSFDSCRWSAFFQGPWPFQKVGECLRSASSVNAKKRDDSKLDLLAKENKELADSLKANPTCNKLGYPPMGLQADQLPESFADWFSAEVMASFKNIKPSAVRIDLCEKKELNAGSSYVSNNLRLDAIYFTHPKFKNIRPELKENAYQYCGLSPSL